MRARRHAVGFVEDYDLVAAGREGHFLLGKAFDALADYFDACFERGCVSKVVVFR